MRAFTSNLRRAVLTQRCRQRERVVDAGADLLPAFEPVPEDGPDAAPVAAVGLLEVPGVDLVLAARAPEELGVLPAHARPERSADARALRLRRDGELVEVRDLLRGGRRGAGQDRRRAVRLRQVDAVERLLV